MKFCYYFVSQLSHMQGLCLKSSLVIKIGKEENRRMMTNFSRSSRGPPRQLVL